MRISFIVLTYNRSDAALAVLRALARQCGASDEIVVGDDGSRGEHVEPLLAASIDFPCRAQHVWHPDVGFTAAAARNRAVQVASGDYLVFLDGDCVPGPHFVRNHRRLAEVGTFVNGSRVLLSPDLTREVLDQGVDLSALGARFWWQAWRRGQANKLNHLFSWPARLRMRTSSFRWRGIRSCNFGVWRADFVAVNGFDQVFEGWGHEDADLVLRLHHHGLQRKNGFLSTEVFHLWHPENSRGKAEENRRRVLERQQSRWVRAVNGLAELPLSPAVIRSQLGRK